MKTQFLVILVAMQMLVGISMANDISNTFSEIESIKLEINKNYIEGMSILSTLALGEAQGIDTEKMSFSDKCAYKVLKIYSNNLISGE